MDTFKNSQYIPYFAYNNPNQHMSLTEILKHAVKRTQHLE
jgi:hypothetical protein